MIIEALACGVPVAAYPVAGPLDIVGGEGRGADNDFPATVAALDKDLGLAVARALRLDRQAAAVFGGRFTWERATDQFLAAIEQAVKAGAKRTEAELV